jgi:hypothetical protein
MAQARQSRERRIVIAGHVLNADQRAGRACIYCPVTFGPLDPVPAAAGVEGVMFLAAHRRCIDNSRVGSERRALARRARA